MTYLLIVLLLTMLLAFGTIWFSRSWKFSALTCIMIGAICSTAYFYSLTQRGWPSESQLPDKFVILGVNVKEPDASSKGAIYYWVRSIPSDKNGTPLNIQMPYSKEAHEQAREIQKRMRNNQNVQGRRQGFGEEGNGFGRGMRQGRNAPGQHSGGGEAEDDAVEGSSVGKGGRSRGRSLRDRAYEFINPPNIPNYQFELVEPETLPPKDGSMDPGAPSSRI